MPITPKDYLGFENARNRKYAGLYTDIVKLALGCRWAVLIGHHILYEYDGRLDTANEIPSADTLMFDHPIMRAVFGERCIEIMRELAAVPCEQRDQMLAHYFYQAYPDRRPA